MTNRSGIATPLRRFCPPPSVRPACDAAPLPTLTRVGRTHFPAALVADAPCTTALSCLDNSGDGPVLVALHGHWMEGVTFAPLAAPLAPLAAPLAPAWRVLALDQGGHGDSDHAPSYSGTLGS